MMYRSRAIVGLTLSASLSLLSPSALRAADDPVPGILAAPAATVAAQPADAAAAGAIGVAPAAVTAVEATAGQPIAPGTTQPTTQAATQPATKPTTQPVAQPATQPTTQPSIALVTRQNGGIVLTFRDASIDAVLDQLSEVGGFVVFKEVKPEGRITILSRQPVKPSEAISLLNTALKTNGYAAILQGDRILKIVSREKAKKSNIPVHSGSDPLQIAATDELITQVMPLRFTDATQLKNDLAPLIGTDADFSANASSNSLLITDSAANIRRIAEIVAALDKSMADAAEVKVFRLEYASASAAARLITDVFRTTDQTGRGGAGGTNPFQAMMSRMGGGGGRGGGGFGGGAPGGGGFGFAGAGGPGGGRGGDQGARRQVPLTASSDDRTNTVVVSGPKDMLAVIEGVVKQLDADPSADQGVFVYPLKNGVAANLAIVVNNLFGASGGMGGTRTGTTGFGGGGFGGTTNRGGFGGSTGGFGGSSGGMGGSSRGGTRSTGSAFGGSSGMTGRGGTGGGFGGSSGFGGSTGFGGGMSSGRGGMSGSSSAAAGLSGQVYVVANVDTNSLLVMTNPKNYPKVKDILDELDRSIPQVLIKCLIAEVSHDDSRELGAEFSLLNLRANGMGPKVGTDFGLAGQSTGLVFRLLEKDITATIRALDKTGKLDVLSRPYILASDNQLATITVGQEVPFITNSRTTDTGQTINTIQYNDIGIILNVLPHINPDGLVIMDVAPEISALTGTTVPVSTGVSAAVFAKRSAQTRVAIRDGQTIVIGGLMEDRKTETISKVPLLGDIPFIGALFQSKNVEKNKTELLIFLTPQVAQSPSDLTKRSADEEKSMMLVPTAVEPGAFDAQMDAMHRGAATQPADQPRNPLTEENRRALEEQMKAMRRRSMNPAADPASSPAEQ